MIEIWANCTGYKICREGNRYTFMCPSTSGRPSETVSEKELIRWALDNIGYHYQGWMWRDAVDAVLDYFGEDKVTMVILERL